MAWGPGCCRSLLLLARRVRALERSAPEACAPLVAVVPPAPCSWGPTLRAVSPLVFQARVKARRGGSESVFKTRLRPKRAVPPGGRTARNRSMRPPCGLWFLKGNGSRRQRIPKAKDLEGREGNGSRRQRIPKAMVPEGPEGNGSRRPGRQWFPKAMDPEGKGSRRSGRQRIPKVPKAMVPEGNGFPKAMVPEGNGSRRQWSPEGNGSRRQWSPEGKGSRRSRRQWFPKAPKAKDPEGLVPEGRKAHARRRLKALPARYRKAYARRTWKALPFPRL